MRIEQKNAFELRTLKNEPAGDCQQITHDAFGTVMLKPSANERGVIEVRQEIVRQIGQ